MKNNAGKCPVSDKCGGCRYQGLPYEEQLNKKQSHVIYLLGKYGHVESIVGMEDPCNYRNKVCSAFGLDAKRRPVCGIYKAGSHAIIPVESCMIEDRVSSAIIKDIFQMLRGLKIQVFDERSGTGWLRHVLVRRGFESGQVMVVLVAFSSMFPAKKFFLKKLLELHPEVSTVVLNVNDRFGPVVLGNKSLVLYGSGYIEDKLCGNTFRISPSSFYQVNPVMTEKLYSQAIEFAGLKGNETVLDAYCGIGTIAITAAAHSGKVVGVELNKDAVRDAITNAKVNGIKNCWFTQGDAGKYMTEASAQGVKFDVVFMDPPRSGSDEAFIGSVLKVKPKKVVYVSCGPDTLARDLELFTKGGYKVERIKPFDMFPFTEHVETVVLLSRD